jgi:hypothetical protein
MPVTAELTDRVEKSGRQRVNAIMHNITQDAPRLVHQLSSRKTSSRWCSIVQRKGDLSIIPI